MRPWGPLPRTWCHWYHSRPAPHRAGSTTARESTGAVASGPLPPTGAYQLFGRLDTIVSAPVVLTVVA